MKKALRQALAKMIREERKALIVDTRKERARMLNNCMAILNYNADIAESELEAISNLSSISYKMVVIGDCLSSPSGLDLSNHIRTNFPYIDVIDLSKSDDLNRFWKAVAVACL